MGSVNEFGFCGYNGEETFTLRLASTALPVVTRMNHSEYYMLTRQQNKVERMKASPLKE